MTSTSPSLTVTKVNDVDNDFHMGTWINTGLYTQAWKAIAVKGDYAEYDWTVKVDADAVFFPPTGRSHQALPVAPTGAFLANCEGMLSVDCELSSESFGSWGFSI